MAMGGWGCVICLKSTEVPPDPPLPPHDVNSMNAAVETLLNLIRIDDNDSPLTPWQSCSPSPSHAEDINHLPSSSSSGTILTCQICSEALLGLMTLYELYQRTKVSIDQKIKWLKDQVSLSEKQQLGNHMKRNAKPIAGISRIRKVLLEFSGARTRAQESIGRANANSHELALNANPDPSDSDVFECDIKYEPIENEIESEETPDRDSWMGEYLSDVDDAAAASCDKANKFMEIIISPNPNRNSKDDNDESYTPEAEDPDGSGSDFLDSDCGEETGSDESYEPTPKRSRRSKKATPTKTKKVPKTKTKKQKAKNKGSPRSDHAKPKRGRPRTTDRTVSVGVRRTAFQCEICCRPYTNIHYLNRHLWSHCNEEEISQKLLAGEQDPRDAKQLSRYKPETCICEECGKIFKSMIVLKIHANSHKPEDEQKKWICEDKECAKAFITYAEFRAHKIKVHRPEDQVKWYVCNICPDKRYLAPAKLHVHNMRHHGAEKPIQCEICGMRFIENTELKKHLVSHEGPDYRPFQCEFCPEGYRQMRNLCRHVNKAHPDKAPPRKENPQKEKEKPVVHSCKQMFPCPACEKPFELPSRMKKHFTTCQDPNRRKRAPKTKRKAHSGRNVTKSKSRKSRKQAQDEDEDNLENEEDEDTSEDEVEMEVDSWGNWESRKRTADPNNEQRHPHQYQHHQQLVSNPHNFTDANSHNANASIPILFPQGDFYYRCT